MDITRSPHNDYDKLLAVEILYLHPVIRPLEPLPVYADRLTYGRLFGQLLLFYAFKHSGVSQLSGLVPTQYESWTHFALSLLAECAPASPIVAREYEVASALLNNASLLTNS